MAGSTIDRAAHTGSALVRRLKEMGPNGYAPWLDRGACQAVIAQGLPDTRSEPWKYTNVNRWYDVALANHGHKPRRVHVPDGVRVVDFGDPGARQLLAAHQGTAFDLVDHPLAAVNGLLLGAGVALVVAKDTVVEQPVRIEDLGAAYQHILVIVLPGASITLIEEPATFAHRIVEGVVGSGGRLQHLRRQSAAHSRECSLVAMRLDADAHYTLAQSSRGAELRRNDVLVTLAGARAQATITSVWRLQHREHLDNHVTVHHVAPQGFSRQTYRGVVGDRARAVLNGRIHIASGAKGTDAALNTKSLLATDKAEVYAKPELEIYESDVKCSHGATVGTLDDAAVFFFRSRGLSEQDARALLVRGFLREAIGDAEGAASLGLAS